MSLNQFDLWSKTYDWGILQWLFFGPSHGKLLNLINLPEHTKVLDIGCGTGIFLNRVLEKQPNVEVVGLDLSEGMLYKAVRKLPDQKCNLVRGNSERLPFKNDSFDVVTCIHSFHHYPHQQSVLSEVNRVLKPDGQLLIVDGNRDSWWGWFIFDCIVTTIERKVHHCSAKQFRNLLHSTMFGEIEQYKEGWIAPFLINQAKKLSI